MLSYVRTFPILAVVVAFQAQAENLSYAPPGYRLAWADEFVRAGLPDPTNWDYDTEANATGWYNDELQYYAVARPETTRVFDGVLSIIARKERLTSADDYGGQAYSSGRMTTRGKQEWTFGHFELRAKLPCGKGTWPSFLSLGPDTVPWPNAGEIDILSQAGADPTKIYPTIHTKATAEAGGVGGSVSISDPCESFHTYHATWTPDEITIGVDGTNHLTYRNTGDGVESWPFDKPRYLIVNLAIGGTGGGDVDDSIFPVSFDIDYVRVYQIPQ